MRNLLIIKQLRTGYMRNEWLIKQRTGSTQATLTKEQNMADTLIITLCIVAEESSCGAIAAELSRLAGEAAARQEGFRAGGGLHIHDAEMAEPDEGGVILCGRAKGDFGDGDVRALAGLLRGIADFESLVLEYSAPDRGTFGRYVFSGRRNRLECIELPAERWPGDDARKLVRALRKYGVRRVIGTDGTREEQRDGKT